MIMMVCLPCCHKSAAWARCVPVCSHVRLLTARACIRKGCTLLVFDLMEMPGVTSSSPSQAVLGDIDGSVVKVSAAGGPQPHKAAMALIRGWPSIMQQHKLCWMVCGRSSFLPTMSCFSVVKCPGIALTAAVKKTPSA